MRNLRVLSLTAVAALTIVSTAVLLRLPGSALSRAELAAHDHLVRQGRGAPANDKLIFLAVDNESVSLNAETDLEGLFGLRDAAATEGKALKLMSQEWPWSREVYALILDRLVAAGARVVVFDLLFPKPAEGDEALAAALQRHADRVVIGSNMNTSLEAGRLSVSVTPPSPTLIPPGESPDHRVGLVNFWPDADESVRAAQFHVRFSDLLDAPTAFGTVHESLAARVVTKLGRADLIPKNGGNRPFNFTGGPQTFPAHSIFEIFVPEYWERNYRGGSVFKDAVVIVGAAGNWQHDQHPTPWGIMPGPELQLNVINGLLHGAFLKPCSWLGEICILLGVGLVAVGISLWTTKPLWRAALLIAFGAAGLAVGYWLYNSFGLILPAVAPLTVLGITGVFGFIYDLGVAGADQLRLRRQVHDEQLTQQVLARANEELDGKVKERTAELSALLDEKNVLLKEVHHRVKNNMQVISSLLNLQAGHIKDAAAREIFMESKNRVRSMALIHEKLYQTEDLSKIDFGDYLKTLTSGLAASFTGKGSQVRIISAVDEIMLGVDAAVPCGLIVNELVTNAFKYAFPAGGAGEIRIAMKRTAEAQLQLSVSDNGIGFPKDLDFRETESLGMQLVTTLAEQLEGSVAMRNGCGTAFEITFPENSNPKV